jgi:hypothetical protein
MGSIARHKSSITAHPAARFRLQSGSMLLLSVLPKMGMQDLQPAP